MDKETINRSIDACRPGSDDLFRDEMASLAELVENNAAVRHNYDRAQRLDTAIGAAFRDVELPPGLEDRLLAGLEQSLKESIPAAESAAGDTRPRDQEENAAVSPASKGIERRRVWRSMVGVAALALVMMAAVAVAVVIYNLPRQPVSLDELVEQTNGWIDKIQHDAWQTADTEGELAARPLEPSIRVGFERWQRIETDLDSRAVVYDLASPGGRLALAFTIRTSLQYNVPPVLTTSPGSTTGGFSIGACQRDGVLFILVVEGEAERYEEFVRSRLPVT